MKEWSRNDRDRLIEENLKYARLITTKICTNLRIPVRLWDDCRAAGDAALVEAAHSYNPKKETSFRSYAFFRIKGGIIDCLRQMSDIPRTLIPVLKTLTDIKALLPHISSFAKGTKEHDLSTAMSLAGTAALSYSLCQREFEATRAEGREEKNPEKIMIKKSEGQHLRRLMKTLPPHLRRVVYERYFRDKTLKQIGASLGVEESWASKMHARAITRLQKKYFLPHRPENSLFQESFSQNRRLPLQKAAREFARAAA